MINASFAIATSRDGSPDALALYLLLCTVADAQGSSYYSDPTLRKLLSFTGHELRSARTELVDAGLIAYSAPFYQVLSLEPWSGASRTSVLPAAQAPEARIGRTQSMAEILRAMLDSQQAHD